MSDLRKYLNRRLDNPEFASEWERTEAEYEVMKLIADARSEKGWTTRVDGPVTK